LENNILTDFQKLR